MRSFINVIIDIESSRGIFLAPHSSWTSASVEYGLRAVMPYATYDPKLENGRDKFCGI